MEDGHSTPCATVILLCGLPGSGKSTVARRLVELSLLPSSSLPKIIHVEYDALEQGVVDASSAVAESASATASAVASAHDSAANNLTTDIDWEARRKAWNEARRIAMETLRCGLDELVASPLYQQRQRQQQDVPSRIYLLNDNYHLRGMRKQVHRLLCDYAAPPATTSTSKAAQTSVSVKFGILWMDTAYDVCVDRNDRREGRERVPQHVMDKMRESFEPPGEVYWEANCKRLVQSVHNDSQDNDAHAILQFIRDCAPIVQVVDESRNEEELHAERLRTLQNQIHQMDQKLRKFVGVIARRDRSCAKAANAAKDKLRWRCKEGDAQLMNADNSGFDHQRVIAAFVDQVLTVVTPASGGTRDGFIALLSAQK